MDKLKEFHNQAVTYLESQLVKEGVEADLYIFNGDTSKDLAIVRVAAGYKTPLQRVLTGKKTIEGYLNGKATLTVISPDNKLRAIVYPGNNDLETIVEVNDTMQWAADTNLTFYEICWPPFSEGRFENLS